MLGNYFYWVHTRGDVEWVRGRWEFSFYFLAAPACLLAQAFEAQNFAYLALIPTLLLMGLGVVKSKSLRSWALILSLLGLGVVMAFAQESLPLKSIDVMILLSLLAINLGPMTITRNANDDSEDRLFLHDLSGEIHGLGLYIDANLELDHGSLKSMVKSLSQMVRSYSEDAHGFSHRNFKREGDVLSYAECFKELQMLVKTYLSGAQDQVYFSHAGLLEHRSAWSHFYLSRSHYRRLMLNIVKNISEAGSTQIEFRFCGTHQGLSFEIRNNLAGLSDISSDLESFLGPAIADAHERAGSLGGERGLGLVSMAKICEQDGGSFHFSFESECWITAGVLCWQAEQIDTSGPIAA